MVPKYGNMTAVLHVGKRGYDRFTHGGDAITGHFDVTLVDGVMLLCGFAFRITFSDPEKREYIGEAALSKAQARELIGLLL